MSKGKRYDEEQIMMVLKEIEAGSHGITDQTIYRWRERYGGISEPAGLSCDGGLRRSESSHCGAQSP